MKYWQAEKGTLYNGESLEILKTLPDESVNCIITSPPYWGLRDYGTGKWEGGDKDCSHKRDNKLSELYDTGQKNVEGGIGDAIYKDYCKRCGANRIDKQLGLEKTFQEYIDRLCNIFDEIKRVLRQDGTCWVVIGDTYGGGGGSGSKEYFEKGHIQFGKKDNKRKYQPPKIGMDKCLCLIPSRFAIEMTNRGWILRNKNIWHKANCMPSSVKDRFTVDYEEIFFFVKNKKYWFEQQVENGGDWGTRDRSKFRMNTKYKKLKHHGMNNCNFKESGRNKRTVWQINPKPYPESHFAVFPEELVEIPIKAGCPKDGVVADPFGGSGTVGVVAKKRNMKWILIELNKEYCAMAKKRIERTRCQFKLF